MSKPYLILLFLALFTITVNGQETQQNLIGSAGGSGVSLSGIRMDYSVGDLITATYGSTNVMTCGFQQSNLMAVISVPEAVSPEFNAFPNPSTGLFNFTSSLAINYYVVTDLIGKQVTLSNNNQSTGVINLEEKAQGFYTVTFYFINGQNQTVRLCKY